MITRLIDAFKSMEITAMFTSLTTAGHESEDSVIGVSSLIDTWIQLRNQESNGERNRTLYVLKARGMAHSNQVREFALTDNGVQLLDVYTGPGGVLTGSARKTQEAQDRAATLERKEEVERRKNDLQRKREQLSAQIASLREEYKATDSELRRSLKQIESRDLQIAADRSEMAIVRRADLVAARGNGRKLKIV